MPNGHLETVTIVKDLGTGYVRVEAPSTAWAQLPIDMWNSLLPGDLVPSQYVFDSAWHCLAKPKSGGENV